MQTAAAGQHQRVQLGKYLQARHVEVLGATPGWLRYRLPSRAVRHQQRAVCIGQKQVWFLLRLRGDESEVRLDATGHPEFDRWRWVDFWYPMAHVVTFKRSVYARALNHLAPYARAVAGSMLVTAWPSAGPLMRTNTKPSRSAMYSISVVLP